MSNPSSPGSPSKVFIDIDPATTSNEEDEPVGFDLAELKCTLAKEQHEEDNLDAQSASTDSQTEEAFKVNFYDVESSSGEEEEEEEEEAKEDKVGAGGNGNVDKDVDSKIKHKKKKKKKKGLSDPNKFAIKRDKLKKKILKGVMDQVLPDIGAYDSKNIIRKDTSSSNGFILQCCKVFGCFSASLNEGVQFASIKSINRTIDKLQRFKKLDEHINAYDGDGRTPLINAIMTRKQPNPDDPSFLPFAIIERLLEVGADLNAPDQLFGMTPLLYACSLKDEETALLLLKLGADPHMCDFRACTPVMLCAGLNLPTTLTILLYKLPDVDAQDQCGWTSCHYASWGGYVKCLKLLVQNGADRSILDNKKRRAIDIARYQEYYVKQNPPLTHAEVLNSYGREYGPCVAALEDTKSKLADFEEEEIVEGAVTVF